MDAGDGGHGAGGAEQVGAGIHRLERNAVLTFEPPQMAKHGVDHGGEHLLADLATAIALGECNHPDRYRRPGGNATLHLEPALERALGAVAETAEVEPDELRRAAANVENQRPVRPRIEQRGATRDGQARLGLAAYHFKLEPRLPAHPLEKQGPVGGPATSFSGNEARPHNALLGHLVGAYLEGGNGARHGRVRKGAALAQPLAQTNDAREAVDHQKPAPRRPRDEETTIVGAKIERAIERPAAGAAAALPACGRPL